MLSIEQMSTPSPLNDTVSLFDSASYRLKGSSMEVHSFMNSMEPPGSAEMSQIATSLEGRVGQPGDFFSHGVDAGEISVLASGILRRRGVWGDQ